jgi:hypothetical protein
MNERSDFAPFDEGEKHILSLEIEERHVESLGFPWPKRGHSYVCTFAIHPGKDGIFVDGPEEILYYCSEVGYDLESITDLPLAKMEHGVYRAKFKYWANEQYLYSSGETEFEDGLEVTEIEKVAL